MKYSIQLFLFDIKWLYDLIDIIISKKGDIMAKCYICEKEITDENKSKEHILLNAIGGRLKSYDLLCKNCNSNLGSDIDVELAKQFHPFMVFLNIKRDREGISPYSTKRIDNGEDILIYPGGKPKLRHSIIKHEDNGNIRIIVSDEKEAQRKFNEIKKKNPNAEIQEKEFRKEFVSADLSVEFNDNTFFSLAKTAIGYYIYTGGERNYIKCFIDSFIKKDLYDKYNYFYPQYSVVEKADILITHTILIIGNPQERILYCYIELFNFFKCIFLMNDDYSGPEIKKTYCFDLLGGIVIEVTTTLDLLRQDLLDYIKNVPPKHIDPLLKEYGEFLKLMQLWNFTNKICDKANEELEHQCQEDFLSKEFSDLFIKYSIEEMIRMGKIKK